MKEKIVIYANYAPLTTIGYLVRFFSIQQKRTYIISIFYIYNK